MKPHLDQSRGFTLIELLIALSLYGVVLLIITSTLRGGLQLWERDGKKSTRTYEVELLFRKMSEEFENMIPFAGFPLEGKSNSIIMISVTAPGSFYRDEKQVSRIRYWTDGENLFREEKKLAAILQRKMESNEELDGPF